MSFTKRLLVACLVAAAAAQPVLAAQDAMNPGESTGHDMVPKTWFPKH